MVVLIVRKYNPKKRRIGLYRCPWIHKENILLPETITTEKEFAEWIQSKWGSGRFYISLSARRYRGFKTVFIGEVKDGKATGRGRWKYYLAKNKERLERNA